MKLQTLLILGVVGFLAQMVDGSLGMGYGATSSSLLLAVGLTPATASASVHLAELGTNLASGATHWRLGNVDRRTVLTLGVPGAVGAFAGARFLSWISTEVARPVMGAILLSLGVYILVRFSLRSPRHVVEHRPHGRGFLMPLGLLGGFVDATGGGGWGPITTSTLLSAGRTAPRKVVGSVDTSEFLVTLAASLGFLVALGSAGISWPIVVTLLAGGLVAAPIAAWLVTKIPPSVLGVAVGGLVIATNLGTVFSALGVGGTTAIVGASVTWAAWFLLVGRAVVRHRRHVRALGVEPVGSPV